MAIKNEDIKLRASERLSDAADGGGQMAVAEIVDGQVNNLFPDISRLDRTLGRVNLRKAFLHVDTENEDTYLGAHAIVTKPPADPDVSATLFDTDSAFDERDAAKNFVEQYVIPGPTTTYYLQEQHLEGQRTIRLWGSSNAELPRTGDIYQLSVESGNYPAHAQYVRIVAVTAEIDKQFEAAGGGNLSRNVYTCEIASALDQDYPGADPHVKVASQVIHTKIRDTTVADIANYYGVVELKNAAAIGDRVLDLESIYTQLVPATTAEDPIADLRAALGNVQHYAAGAPLLKSLTGLGLAVGVDSIYLGGPVVPETLLLAIRGGTGSFVGDVLDDGAGALYCEAAGVAITGTIDYATGLISYVRTDTGGGSMYSVTFTPAARFTGNAYSHIEDITLVNQRLNYVETLDPRPEPKSLVVHYMALGQWYTLRDKDGDGTIRGDLSDTGVGTIDYATGTTTVTLGALPDAGSALLYQWAESEGEVRLINAESPAKPHFVIELGDAAAPDTVTINWTAGGLAKSAVDDASGVLSGDGTGRVLYGDGKIILEPDELPDLATSFSVDWDKGGQESSVFADPLIVDVGGNNFHEFTLPSAPIAAGTVNITVPYTQTAWQAGGLVTTTTARTWYDDGAGAMLYQDNPAYSAGTIDYATGLVRIPESIEYTSHERRPVYTA